MKSRIVLTGLAIMVLMSSCVSKKMFLTMQDAYEHKTDSLVSVTDDLNARLESGEFDFESTKQDFLISDASKNDQIADLEKQLKELQSGFNEMSQTLSATQDKYETTQSQKDQASYQMARMNSEIVKLKQDTASINYALKLQRRKSANLKTSLDQQKERYSTDIDTKNEKISQLKKESETARLKAKELERQLAIKQKQLTEVGENFIALRKEMLKANGQGTTIDPNTNTNVSNIAKSLGQY